MQRDLLLLGEMIEAAEQAQVLVSGVDLSELESDRQRRDALLWNFTVLGEAAAQLDEAVRNRFPEIPWARPARLRNRIIHGYWSIDLEILHTTARDVLPKFVDQLQAALQTLETDPESDNADGA
ncbi:MAG: DUF86 domain-containing protein [Acidimicrobiia bacterium]|nr:DUF86 domain-containing protein [Acidimicrobiia bacterium]